MALALALVAGAALLTGCGTAAPGSGESESGNGGSREAARRQEVMSGVLGILTTVGMESWADYGQTYLSSGRVVAVDFSSPTANQWGVSGLDAAADPTSNTIYVDQAVWLEMPPRHLAIVMLDELAHLYYRTPNHEVFDALHADFIQRWETRFGRGFNTLGPEDSAYQEWWDAFLRANPNG